jgi:hydroxyacylglutathione hydrolase
MPTLPVTLAEEKRCNPFLRCEDATMQARIAVFTGKKPNSTLETFTHLREMKNHF